MLRIRTPLLAAAISLAACDNASAPETATVYYVLDAPLCSSQLPMQFSIDNVLVGEDTFRIHLAPDRTKSEPFVIPTGSHTIGARVKGGLVWPDSLVNLAAGTVFEDTLPFYCS
jgi:hypothetical protein